jgi:hypothetical protein
MEDPGRGLCILCGQTVGSSATENAEKTLVAGAIVDSRLTEIPGYQRIPGSHPDCGVIGNLALDRPSAAPVALDPDIAFARAAPVAGNPDGVRPRRSHPASAHPDITSAIPAVVAGDPDPAPMRPRPRMLHNNRRRRNTNNDPLRKGRWNAEHRTRGKNKQKLLHKRMSFLSF